MKINPSAEQNAEQILSYIYTIVSSRGEHDITIIDLSFVLQDEFQLGCRDAMIISGFFSFYMSSSFSFSLNKKCHCQERPTKCMDNSNDTFVLVLFDEAELLSRTFNLITLSFSNLTESIEETSNTLVVFRFKNINRNSISSLN